MVVLVFILLLAALVCALLRTFGVVTARVHCGWLAFAIFLVTIMIQRLPGLVA